MDKKIAIQGVSGSFHEIAARHYFNGGTFQLVQCNSFNALFDALKFGEANYAVVAIENSVAGSIIPNYAHIKDSGLKILGEVYLRIEQHLVGLPGQQIDEVKEIHSHPMAIEQCGEYLNSLRRKGVRIIDSEDTALSAKRISEGELRDVAGISSRLAAEIYHLEILDEGIETNKKNFTRFLILSAEENGVKGAMPNKSGICFKLPHEQGSLSQALSVLAFYKINLTKIQSLPIVGQEWQYLFYVDLVFSDYEKYRLALKAIEPLTSELQVLGEYRQGERPTANQPVIPSEQMLNRAGSNPLNHQL
ncbi:MAG: prephenate dehydratase [Bacteroidetes bacterium]|nr:MAG: prephenate dehydratase [Bacteroidota bacterium]